MARNRFTPEEDKMIIETIKKNPQNIHKCFVALATKLNRSIDSIRCHYYSKIVKDNSNKLFLTVSSRKKYTNYKVQRKGMKAKPTQTTKSKWRRILDILFEK